MDKILTSKQVISEVEAFLATKGCGGKGKDKEKRPRKRKTDIDVTQFCTRKVDDPQFLVERLLDGKSAGFFSRRPQIAKIGERQLLTTGTAPYMAYAIVKQGGPVSSTDIEKFVDNVDNSVCHNNRLEFHNVDSFYYVPLTLVQSFDEPIILKKCGACVDLNEDSAKAMVDPQAFAADPSIVDLANTPDDELLLLRGGLIDLLMGDPSDDVVRQIQQAHALVVDELKERGVMEDHGKAKSAVTKRQVRLLKADNVDATIDERFVFGVVLVPNEADSQGEIYDAREVEKAAHSYMESTNGVIKLMHAGKAVTGVKVLETYVTKTEETHGGETLPIGTWLMAVRVLDDQLWESVKKGVFTGFSIGGTAIRERLR